MVGSAVATMVWSSAARNIVSIRLIRMVRTSLGVSAARGAIGGASLISIDLARNPRQLARDRFGQCLLVGRSTALPFELVHGGACVYRFNNATWHAAARNHWFELLT